MIELQVSNLNSAILFEKWLQQTYFLLNSYKFKAHLFYGTLPRDCIWKSRLFYFNLITWDVFTTAKICIEWPERLMNSSSPVSVNLSVWWPTLGSLIMESPIVIFKEIGGWLLPKWIEVIIECIKMNISRAVSDTFFRGLEFGGLWDPKPWCLWTDTIGIKEKISKVSD